MAMKSRRRLCGVHTAPCKANLPLTTQISHQDDFIKFACHFPDMLQRFSPPNTRPPPQRLTPGSGAWLPEVPSGYQNHCQRAGVTPVAGREQAPASWVKKLGPRRRLPLGVQWRPLAASSLHAASSSQSCNAPGD